MLSSIRAASPLRRAALGTAVVGTGAGAYYVGATDAGRGFRRQAHFWSFVGPVVADYYFQAASSSPYVKYKKWKRKTFPPSSSDAKEESFDELLDRLHKKHAPEILQVMLDLKGLYIKLGQVLSVTTLPIPEDYRILFRTLQSDVPGWELFEQVVKPALEKELGGKLEDIFTSIDPVPCGAASIGQAHKGVLAKDGSAVIVKVQYPDAAWQVPADIQCVGDFLRICVWAGVVDESAARLSFDEFSRQFLAELDYTKETKYLQRIHNSSLNPKGPYVKRNVVVPKVYPELCSSKVITMAYLPGPKLEEEARRQMKALGIDTEKGIRTIVRDVAKEHTKVDDPNEIQQRETAVEPMVPAPSRRAAWALASARWIGRAVGIDTIMWSVRLLKRMILFTQSVGVTSIQTLSYAPGLGLLVPQGVKDWAKDHQTASLQAKRMALTKEWMHALFDVHGNQIFDLGTFNADPHPGNILVVEDEEQSSSRYSTKLGLIDFGQCKELKPVEQVQIAKLLLAVANEASDDEVAKYFRDLGIQTRNDNTEFLAKFARLMFGPLQPYHLDPKWHRTMHKQDIVTYFPNQLSMVYRTSMLLRGLAVSLQVNISVSDEWKSHAEEAIKRSPGLDLQSHVTLAADHAEKMNVPSRRLTRRATEEVVAQLDPKENMRVS